MNKYFKSALFFFLSLCFSISLHFELYSQNSTSESERQGFNLELSRNLNGIYFTDPLGIQLATRLLPFEGTIDRNSYILGSNDLLSIKVDGVNPLFLRSILVNPKGDVVLPLIGAVNISGLTIMEAEKKVENALSDQFKDPKASITIDNPRPVIYHVTGGVPHPGKYITSPNSRVDQAIFSSLTTGDRNLTRNTSNSSEFLSNNNFSFRSIKIYHADGSESSADLLKYFRTGDLTSNPFVMDGDLVFVQQLNRETPKISISGAVKSDLEFEFKKGDTPKLVLSIGGGFEEVADTSKLFVYRRSVTGIEQIIVESQDWDTFQLMANDRVVAPFGNKLDLSASAWVYGEVNIPGNFPIESGSTTAFELLEYAEGLTENALPAAAYLIRVGGQRNAIPNEFNADLMKRTSDQVIQGLEYLDAETNLSRNRVNLNLTDQEQLKSLKIFDGDRLYIPQDNQTVFVFGQVNNPGFVAYSSSKTVDGYINQAGGFALSADKERVFILKAGNANWYNVGDTQLSSGDKIFVDRLPVEDLYAKRQFEIQKQQLRNQRTQLIMAGITTATGIITTYLAIENFRRTSNN